MEQNYFLFAHDIVMYFVEPKYYTTKPFDMVNTFSEVLGHETNVRQSVCFL